MGGEENATRSTNTSSNQWYKDWHWTVPGWPASDGKYYDVEGPHDEPSSKNPAGDVTDEEIQYVSWWFRTYGRDSEELKNRQVNLHLSDYWVQLISSDNDRDKDGNRLTKSTDYEFKDGEWKINDNETKGGQGFNSEMTIDKFETLSIDGQWENVNNFNHSNSNRLYDYEVLSKDTELTTKDRVIVQFTSSGTEDFRGNYSNGGGELGEYDGNKLWTLVRLEFDGPKTGRHYVGYYLGFDYVFYGNVSGTFTEEQEKEWANKVTKVGPTVKAGQPTKFSEIKPDGYYSNWILKITPAHKSDEYTRRIMCEDSGNTYDFDFNDVVFDVTHNGFDWNEHTDDWTITLQAAGGTLPIYVGVDPTHTIYEIHNLLGGNPSSEPINVIEGGTIAEVASYHVKTNAKFSNNDWDWGNPDNIPIYVVSKEGVATKSLNEILQEQQYASKGSAVPQKICVPTSTKWLKEKKVD